MQGRSTAIILGLLAVRKRSSQCNELQEGLQIIMEPFIDSHWRLLVRCVNSPRHWERTSESNFISYKK